jgi:hypothetical protein
VGDPRTLGEQLEAAHQRFEVKVRHHEVLRAVEGVQAAQAQVLDLARRGVKDAARAALSGVRGGRPPKVEAEELAAAVQAYRQKNPSHSADAADQAVAQDYRVGVRTVIRARRGK